MNKIEINLESLYQLADKATQGEWIACAVRVDGDRAVQAISVDNNIIIETIENYAQDSRNIDFIEAFNPIIAKELITRLRKYEQNNPQ